MPLGVWRGGVFSLVLGRQNVIAGAEIVTSKIDWLGGDHGLPFFWHPIQIDWIAKRIAVETHLKSSAHRSMQEAGSEMAFAGSLYRESNLQLLSHNGRSPGQIFVAAHDERRKAVTGRIMATKRFLRRLTDQAHVLAFYCIGFVIDRRGPV